MFYRSGQRRRRWVQHQLLLLPRQLVITALFVLEKLLHFKKSLPFAQPYRRWHFFVIPFNLKAGKIDTN
jgi:hypothetical protein